MKAKSIIVSTASLAAAIQGVAGIAAEHKQIDISRTDAFANEVSEAVSGAQPQAMIRMAAPMITNTVRVDEKLMREYYAEAALASGDPTASAVADLLGSPAFDVAAASEYEQDSTRTRDAVTCYSNCHSACHGSRGWR